MTIGMNLRKSVSGVVLALAMITVPVAAQAKDSTAGDAGVAVCNMHGNHRGGDLVAFDADANGVTGLRAMPGNGGGLYHAAANSPALTECGILDSSAAWGGSNV